MEQHPFGDESAVHLEMHLPAFPDSQGLTSSEALGLDLSLNGEGVPYAGVGGLDAAPGLQPADAASEAPAADLTALSVYPAKDCGSLQLLGASDPRPSQHEPALPAPMEPGGGGGAGGCVGRGRHPLVSRRASLPGCGRCGKVFSSASALSKHGLTHSQKREHVCAVCSKAFKRPDHLSGHMATHQKTKPFACPHRGCAKSYCDPRSLRRHCELQHGWCGSKEAPKEGAGEESPLLPAPCIQGGGKPVARLAVRCAAGPFPPSGDPPRCVVTSFANQKPPSAALPSAWADPASSSQASCLAPEGSGFLEAAGDDVATGRLPCPKSAAASSVCAAIDPGDVSVLAPGESVVTHLSRRPFVSEAQLPSEPQRCPAGPLPSFSVFRGWKPSTNQPSGSFQWMRDMLVCAKPQRSDACLAHEPPATAQGVSEGFAGPSLALSAAYECPDASPLKAKEDAPRKFEEAPDSHPWEDAGALIFPEVQKWDGPPSQTRQLFPKPQDPAACPEAPQLQRHLFQLLAASRQVPSHARAPAPVALAAPEAECLPANPLRAGFQQLPPWTPQLPQPTGYKGLSAPLQASVPHFQGVLSDGEKQGAQAAPAFQSPARESAGPRGSSVPSWLWCGTSGSAAGSRSSGSWDQLENKDSALKKEESRDCGAEAGGKLPAGAGRCWRLPAVRREKLPSGPSCAAPPSQVAMASFSAPAATRRLTIFNRIQGGNIYSLTKAAEESRLNGCDKTGAAPAADRESAFLRESGGQHLCAESGLESRRCFRGERWRSPPRAAEQQVSHAGGASARTPPLEAAAGGDPPSAPEVPSEDGTAAPLVIPVSVPVTATSSRAANKVPEGESLDGKVLKESSCQKKRKRQTRPKSLFIPPPATPEAQPGPGGCYQSNLRSPVFLVDHLLRDLFQGSPYTPPPMLSPVREGSGLYFSTLCSSSADGDPSQLLGAALGRTDGDFGFCLVKESARIGVQPHINVGRRFQAEVPNLRDRSLLGKDEQAASLVWKPWGDIATNPETQDRVTELLNMACSSVMPGGGTNLELALHCLHEARGSVLEALEMLLFGVPQKPEPHPLANYRYAGSDTWTPLEKQLFRKAFCVHRKDFYLIQKQIQTKNVSQCVEYYYIWKKKIKFDYSRAQVIGKKVKRDKDEVEEAGEKAARGSGKRRRLLPKGSLPKRRAYHRPPHGVRSDAREPPCPPGSAGRRALFPCQECERVFDKIKGRNAHMKSHRLQEPGLRVKWPLKHPKSKAEREETQTPTSSGGDCGAVTSQ
ncbi:zinc finger protein 541 isoform X1 [Phalacrocorax carbo]|uniref:zinc finger protein 541 isoform X1 n=1 Tax=Phalacrocorax carbo TaxID=9209 RepID=UPI00311933F9